MLFHVTAVVVDCTRRRADSFMCVVLGMLQQSLSWTLRQDVGKWYSDRLTHISWTMAFVEVGLTALSCSH
eukprot:3738945-Amphidinium_carterae.1